MAASEKTAAAYAAIRDYRLANGMGIDTLDDPQESGLVGVDKSVITTDHTGDSVNPSSPPSIRTGRPWSSIISSGPM